MTKLSALDNHRNADGTVNGCTFFAEITGISADELKWMFSRLKELRDSGVPRDESKRLVTEEAKLKPWASL